MARLLYRVRNGMVEFRRHEDWEPKLSAHLPDELARGVLLLPDVPAQEQVDDIISQTPWRGARAFDVDTYPGKAFLGKRSWDV